MIPALRHALMSGIRFVVDLSGITGVDATSTSATCYAGLQFKDDGSIYKRSGGAASTYNDSGQDWGTQNKSGMGSNYWVRCTITAGVLTSGTTGSWVSIATEPTWTNSDTDVSASSWQEGTVTFEVSSDASGSPIVDTITGILIKANRIP